MRCFSLLAYAIPAGDVSARLVTAATLLGGGAMLSGTPAAASAVAHALPPLFLLSICQGWLQSQGRPRNQLSTAGVSAHPLVDLPADFPRELLADTEEGRRLEEQEAERVLLQAQRAEAEESEIDLPVIELMGCWRLSAAHHTALLQGVLLPLAAKHVSPEVLQALGPQCSAAFQGISAGEEGGASGGGSPSSSGQGGLHMWTAPSLAELAAGGAAAPTTEVAIPQQAAAVLAVLQVLGQAPVTILTPEHMSFAATASAPWDAADVVYLASSVGAPAGGRQPDHRGAASSGQALVQLRRRIVSLVQGDDWEGQRQGKGGQAEADLVDAVAVQGVLSKAVEVRLQLERCC